jgi:YtkA-like/Recombinase zinc beta ribbon domain
MRTSTKGAIVAAALAFACTKVKPNGEVLQVGDFQVQLRLDPDPPAAGENVLHLALLDAAGKPVDGAKLGFGYDMPAMGAMPEMKGGGETRALRDGKYDVTYPLAMLGDWTLTLAIEAPNHPPAELRFKVSPQRKGYTVEQHATASAGEGMHGPGIEVSPERQQLIGVAYCKVERCASWIKQTAAEVFRHTTSGVRILELGCGTGAWAILRYILRGLLRCAGCGGFLTPGSTRRYGEEHRYYRCVTRTSKGKDACRARPIHASLLEEHIVECVRGTCRSDPASATGHAFSWIDDVLADFSKAWPVLAFPNRRNVLRALIDHVVVDTATRRVEMHLHDAAARAT